MVDINKKLMHHKLGHIHMLGICGMGMGSLALLLKEKGYTVSGSDEHVFPPMSTQLKNAGITICDGYDPSNLEPAPDLVIVGNVIPKINPMAQAVEKQNLNYISMPVAINKLFLGEKKSLVVAGTHGKTTTASLLADLLKSAGKDPSFLIGGIPKTAGKSAQLGSGDYFVLEGDEYDTAYFDKGPKFLHYNPCHVILNAVEFDHADIYRDINHLVESFQKLIAAIPQEGSLVVCKDNTISYSLSDKSAGKVVTTSLFGDADYVATNINYTESGTSFSLQHNDSIIDFHSPLSGEHNLTNVINVLALLLSLGVSAEDLQVGLSKFCGIKRRQEVRGIADDVVVIDDFAHHPTAVEKTIDAIHNRYPTHRVWAVFEPRSNTSRRNFFQKEFGQAFGQADFAIIADVHNAAAIAENERLDSEKLASDINKSGVVAKHISGTDNIIEKIVTDAKPGDVVLIMTNGGFDNIHERLLARLESR